MRKIENLSELKMRELKVLEYFDSFCRESGLKYYLACGTLLGAIRHKGFIPWDDDIDVWMMRDDYNKLVKMFRDNRFRLMCPERTKRNEYTYAWAKLIDQNTRLIEDFQPNIELGVHIDIFPLDYLGNEDVYKKNKKILKERYKRINYLDTAKGFKGLLLKTIGRRNLSRIYRILSKSNKNDSIYVSNVSAAEEIAFVYKKEWFSNIIYSEFEGKFFPTPEKYDEILKTLYGNYMQLPPSNEQKSHHEYSAWVKNL